MSSYIECEMQIKDLAMLKKALDTLGLAYKEAKPNQKLEAKGYYNSKEVDLLVPKSELRKIHYGSYNDVGFVYNPATKSYDMFVDDTETSLTEKIEQYYAAETIKNFAVANRKEYNVVTNEDVASNQDIVIEVYV